MSAKKTDLGRIQEIYDVITETKAQIKSLGFSRERFLEPANDADDLIAEGIINRVFRATEEISYIDEDIASEYDFEQAGARGVRNRIAHVYGEVDREMVWGVVEEDFPAVVNSCVRYCEDHGVDLK